MANGKSDYATALAAGGPALYSRANQSLVNQTGRHFEVTYTGLGNEDVEFFVDLFSPTAPRMQLIPESIRIRHNGTAAFSMLTGFAKLTTVLGEMGVSAFNATFARSTTTCTVTTPAPHGFANNQVLEVTVTSSAAAVPLGTTGIIVVTGPTTFTFTCPNAGDATGTLTVREYVTGLRQSTHARSTTTMTITTQGAHGLIAGQKILIQSIDAASGGVTVASLQTIASISSATVFTVTVANSGSASGTITFTLPQGNFVPITSSAAYTEAAIYTGAGVATVSNGPLGLGASPEFRKTDKLILVWGAATTPVPTTRVLSIEGQFRQVS